MTYDGNRPVTRAMYSLRTVPAMNSSVTKRARSADNGMIIKPDVSRSNLLTANRQAVNDQLLLRKKGQLTITFFISKIINQDLNKRILVITSRRVDRLSDDL